MTPKEKALELIRSGYYGSELSVDELIAELQAAIQAIQECKHDETEK